VLTLSADMFSPGDLHWHVGASRLAEALIARELGFMRRARRA